MDRSPILKAASAFVISSFLVACGGGGSSDPAPAPDPQPAAQVVSAYNGPGSVWDVELRDDDTFTIERRATLDTPVILTVNGTYETSPQGFLLMEVTSASGEDAPAPGDTAWAVEAQGYALMLYTQGDNFVPMIKAGTCPTENFTANLVISRKRSDANANGIAEDYFGSFAYDAASGGATLPARHSISDGFPSLGGQDIPPGTCRDGIMVLDDALMYLTDNGGAIVHTNLQDETDSSFIFALGQKQMTNATALDAEYAGILFDRNLASGEQVAPVSLACTSGVCTGTLVTDVVAGTTDGAVTVDLFGTTNSPIPGFITGTITDGAGGTGNLACMVDENVQDSGQRLISCVGQSPGDNTQVFNVFFASNE